MADNLIETIEKPKKKITNMLEKRRLDNITNNRRHLSHIVSAVLYLGKQGIAFRGHDETSGSKNRGNFLELLHLLSDYDPELKVHLERSRTDYTSHFSQNQLIGVIGHDIICAPIIKAVKAAKFYSILCDEASSGTTEFLSPLCSLPRYQQHSPGTIPLFPSGRKVHRPATWWADFEEVRRSGVRHQWLQRTGIWWRCCHEQSTMRGSIGGERASSYCSLCSLHISLPQPRDRTRMWYRFYKESDCQHLSCK